MLLKIKKLVNEVVMYVKGIGKHTDGKSEAVVVSLTGRDKHVNKLIKNR